MGAGPAVRASHLASQCCPGFAAFPNENGVKRGAASTYSNVSCVAAASPAHSTLQEKPEVVLPRTPRENSVSSGSAARTSQFSVNSEGLPHQIDINSTPFGSGVIVNDVYVVPTRLLTDIFTKLDQRDSPAHPGKVRFSTAQGAIRRFHTTIGYVCRDVQLELDVQDATQVLYEQAKSRASRTGSMHPADALVRWDQNLVLDIFRVKLPRMERLFFTMDISENSTKASKSVSCVIMTAVVLSVITFILSTVESLQHGMAGWVPYADLTCVIIFTVDYGIRVLTVPFARMELLDREFMIDVLMNRQERHLLSPVHRLTSFIKSPMGLVDLMSVLPFWVEFMIWGWDGLMNREDGPKAPHSSALKVFRMVRLFRVFKLGSLTKVDLGEDRNVVLNLFGTVISNAFPALQLVVALVFLALVVLGSLIWYTERGDLFEHNDPHCPHAGLCANGAVHVRQNVDGTYELSPSPFSSIPMSFWWVLVTITTVGYGDMCPITAWGYIVGALTIMYGAVVFALPVGVIGTTFSQAFEQFRAEQKFRQLLAEEALNLDVADTSQVDFSEFVETPPLVTEFLVSMQTLAVTVDLPLQMFKRWEDQLKTVVRFEHLATDHPCVSLERWGNPVIGLLREHANENPLGGAGLTLTLMAWYRLLLHAAQSYEDFRVGEDRVAFELAFRGPVRSMEEQKRTTLSILTRSDGQTPKS